MSKRFYITGVSGVGKSSVARMLNERGIYSIDIDSAKMCHWINNQTKERADWQPGIGTDWLENHGWICDKGKMSESLSQNKDIIVVAGSAVNQEEYLNMFDKVFVLTCKPETFFKRINDRTDNDFGKHESEQEKILEWHESDFNESLIKKGAILIDTDRPLVEVVDDIVSKFD